MEVGMLDAPGSTNTDSAVDSALRVYRPAPVDFAAALTVQRRRVGHIAGPPRPGALLICEHPPQVTIGRQGSVANLRCDLDELRAKRLPVRWVNRGGGCWLQAPGQLAVYPVVALDQQGLGLEAYCQQLQQLI